MDGLSELIQDYDMLEAQLAGSGNSFTGVPILVGLVVAVPCVIVF